MTDHPQPIHLFDVPVHRDALYLTNALQLTPTQAMTVLLQSYRRLHGLYPKLNPVLRAPVLQSIREYVFVQERVDQLFERTLAASAPEDRLPLALSMSRLASEAFEHGDRQLFEREPQRLAPIAQLEASCVYALMSELDLTRPLDSFAKVSRHRSLFQGRKMLVEMALMVVHRLEPSRHHPHLVPAVNELVKDLTL